MKNQFFERPILNSPYEYPRQHWELVPSDMLGDLERAKIVITNYHAFKLRERMDLSKGGRSLLQGRGEALNTVETEGQMLQRGRNQGLPPRGRQGEEDDDGDLLSSRREQPPHVRSLGVRRVLRRLRDAGRLRDQGRRTLQQDDRIRHDPAKGNIGCHGTCQPYVTKNGHTPPAAAARSTTCSTR